jgi:hypothetical protein
MQTNKKIKLSPIKQLIDLNGDKVNFDLNFEVKTIDNSPFEALVVTQTILDSEEEIKYKNVSEGIITGNIVADKGVYDNYFILLRSKNEVECEINITIKDINVNQNLQNQRKVGIPSNSAIPPQIVKKQNIPQQMEPQKISKKNSKINWKLIITIFVLILGSFLLWYFYKNSNKISFFSKNVNKDTDGNTSAIKDSILSKSLENNSVSTHINNLLNDNINNLTESTVSSNLNTEVPKISTPPIIPSQVISEAPPLEVIPNTNSKLLTKINNIPIW